MSLLAAEYRKITRRRLFPVMALVLLAFMAIGVFVFVILPEVAPDSVVVGFPTFGRPAIFELGAQQSANQTWFPVVLAVVSVWR